MYAKDNSEIKVLLTPLWDRKLRHIEVAVTPLISGKARIQDSIKWAPTSALMTDTVPQIFVFTVHFSPVF